ncbi:MAG: tRNA (guanosine(46)-N7)-methyltransferase TrmB [Bacteroidia bacterium]|jgi:tRNA (guanine-N7-)-methyltransferase|nr:tRNA (guanosine(46)-N7)-methyltransferase TrmB [Bacteroidia bacterium]MCC6768981.1 tRNA (guanosine(46)-N7)-methyltransferase TrmB [Bacteroidia bacterium]
MAKRKLQQFAELATFTNVIQQPFGKENFDYPLKGNWGRDFFKNNHPIVLELGCGKGEYSVALARNHPEFNYIGLDIKGNRIWTGAKKALEDNLSNVGFIRSQVDRIGNFFAPGEIYGIWVTFPDPKPKKGNARKRLTSAEMVSIYQKVLRPGGQIQLKTDSTFNYDFTLETIRDNQYQLVRHSEDIDRDYPGEELLQIRTYYEQKFREKGFPIRFVSFIP